MERRDDLARVHVSGITIDFEYGELWRGIHRRNPLSFKKPYSFLVYKDRDVYMAEDWRGRIRYEDDDASEVIPSCIDALPDTGGKIFLKSGTYECEPDRIVLKKWITLVGEGKHNTWLKAKSGGTAILKHDGEATSLRIADLAIDCNGLVDYGIDFEQSALRSAQNRIENVKVINAKTYSMRFVDEDGMVTYGNVAEDIYIDVTGGYHRDYGSRYETIHVQAQGLHLFGTTFYGIKSLSELGILTVKGCYVYQSPDTKIIFDAGDGTFTIIVVEDSRLIITDAGDVLGASGTGSLRYFASLRNVYIRYKADTNLVNIPATYTGVNSARVWLENIVSYTAEGATLTTAGASNGCAIFGREVLHEKRGVLQSGHTGAIYVDSTGVKTVSVSFPIAFPTDYVPRVLASVWHMVDADDAVFTLGVRDVSETGFVIVVNVSTASSVSGGRIYVYWEARPYEG